MAGRDHSHHRLRLPPARGQSWDLTGPPLRNDRYSPPLDRGRPQLRHTTAQLPRRGTPRTVFHPPA
eukprot:3011068-Prorocentrum_lima.AAC.1